MRTLQLRYFPGRCGTVPVKRLPSVYPRGTMAAAGRDGISPPRQTPACSEDGQPRTSAQSRPVPAADHQRAETLLVSMPQRWKASARQVNPEQLN